ncbi:hypothetical protein [Dactylosporangium sp. NPDC050588]|uniref:hypothetical protein n=1 Tax=Dactylosporangium sp. NPDC050588 TaxID=3157211 RepID=UPI0033DE139E
MVSYGGVSAGTRSAIALQTSAYALNLIMLREAVNIPFVRTLLREDEIDATDAMTAAATAMLDELGKVATALRPLHA